jgi:hypothetical protein
MWVSRNGIATVGNVSQEHAVRLPGKPLGSGDSGQVYRTETAHEKQDYLFADLTVQLSEGRCAEMVLVLLAPPI